MKKRLIATFMIAALLIQSNSLSSFAENNESVGELIISESQDLDYEITSSGESDTIAEDAEESVATGDNDSSEDENSENSIAEDAADDLPDTGFTDENENYESDDEQNQSDEDEATENTYEAQDDNSVNQDNEDSSEEDDFFSNISFDFEDGAVSNSSSDELYDMIAASNGIMSISDDVEPTAPVLSNTSSLTFQEDGSVRLRFCATVSPTQKSNAAEYGFLLARTDKLNSANLTLNLQGVPFIKTVAYNAAEGIDHIYEITEDDDCIITAAVSNIPAANYTNYLTIRPYIIYNVNGEQTVVYGNTYSNSIYRTAKDVVAYATPSSSDYINSKALIKAVDYSINLNSAQTKNLSVGIERTLGKDPDVDLLKIENNRTGYVTFDYSRRTGTTISVLDNSKNEVSGVTIYRYGETYYLLEQNQDYYVLVQGQKNSTYTLKMNTKLDDTIVWDFQDNSEGFFCQSDAMNGGNSNGTWKVSINKPQTSANINNKAYIKKNNVNIDMLQFSKVIIHLKNTTDAATIQGYFQIDANYGEDGGVSWSQPTLPMAANSEEYQDIVFDLSSKYGELKSIMFGFGNNGQAVVGDIYIDSVSFVPMPEEYGWEFDDVGNKEGWVENDRIEVSCVDFGKYIYNSLGNIDGTDGAVYSPDNLGLSTDKYNIVKIGLNNRTLSERLDVYYTTNEDPVFSSDKCVKADIEADEGISTYTLEFASQEKWTGILKRIMIVIPADGYAEIDYIRFSNYDSIYSDVVWDFNDNTVDDFTVSSYNSDVFQHSISAQNGALTVTRISGGSGGFFTPKQLKLPAKKFRYLVLGVNSASVTSELRIYFGMLGKAYEENDATNHIANTVSVDIAQSNTFREYVVDLSSCPDGWTSNYNGILDNLMFSLRSSGVFDFDYIMLTDSPNLKSEIDTSINLNVISGQTYNVFLIMQNALKNDDKIYTIKYDPEVLEVADYCSFTPRIDLTLGNIPGTSICVISNNPGELKLRCWMYTKKVDRKTEIV